MEQDLSKLMESATRASESLKCLAHELRLLTICFIGSGEKTVQELENFLGTSQSNMSQHLSKLKDKGFLTSRKQANQVFYRIKEPKVLELVTALQEIYCRKD